VWVRFPPPARSMLSSIPVDSPQRGSHVIRAKSPPRQGNEQDGRESLWVLRRTEAPALRADLIAFTDGVEVELFQDEELRRRWRFLTDSAARGYLTRLRKRLERRRYVDRRTANRPSAWPVLVNKPPRAS
jgi:hypothetical protein